MKIASTRDGLTAIQADIKTQGVPIKVIVEALEQSVRSKNILLDIMEKCISKPRQTRKDCWPVTKQFPIDITQRAQFLGPGRTNLKRIFLETGAHLTETEPNVFNIFAPSPMSLTEAEELIKSQLTPKTIPNLEFGGIYVAQIVEMKENGVMVTLYDGMKSTFIHVAQLDSRRVSGNYIIRFLLCSFLLFLCHFIAFTAVVPYSFCMVVVYFNPIYEIDFLSIHQHTHSLSPKHTHTHHAVLSSFFSSFFSIYSIRLRIRQHWVLK